MNASFQKQIFFFVLLVSISFFSVAQRSQLVWSHDGNAYYELKDGSIVKTSLPHFEEAIVLSKDSLQPNQQTTLQIERFSFSDDEKKILIFTNSKKVWRYNTRGDYWVWNVTTHTWLRLGNNLPASSLMFAKFSPDASKVAYVSGHNIYVEDLTTNHIQQLTTDGNDKMINGTFDWVYEEEFGCRDGFRWSPDGSSIAFWQVDARNIKNFLLINNTDSIYSFVKPVEYPKVGENPSAVRLGIVQVSSGNIHWLAIPGDAIQNYLTRMEWTVDGKEVIVQQLNRKQNETNIFLCNIATGNVQRIYNETSNAWIENKDAWNNGDPSGWEWVKKGTAFIWVSEKDGWRHLYLISKDGKKESLITLGNYDVININRVDADNNIIYFTASPERATEKYLYSVSATEKAKIKLLSPAAQKGTHSYTISPNGLYAKHNFSSIDSLPFTEWVSLPKHQIIKARDANDKTALMWKRFPKKKVELFSITTEDSVTMDGFMVKPENFDSTKKYPVVFFVYSEPASQTVMNSFGAGLNGLYNGDMQKDGYIYISLDGRGTPAPKGAAWRKSIYKNVGIINVRDQAMAAKKIVQWKFVDTSRIAVWGWSGGGSTTLNLLFQYPNIYKTGIAIAPVAYRLTYDNIYEERYMGLPQENKEAYIKASALTYAKNLQGHLLLIHGTGDDNVHYQNTELLINELVKYNKLFQLMSYPNRTHSISEGEGTYTHLSNIYTWFLKTYCPPGAK